MLNKKILNVTLVIGLLIAMLTRVSVFMFTTDFSYFFLFHVAYPQPQEFDFTSTGKSVIGDSGFPFTAYDDCVMGPHGTVASPACEIRSFFGEYSIVLNTLFWAFVLYFVVVIISKFAKSAQKK